MNGSFSLACFAIPLGTLIPREKETPVPGTATEDGRRKYGVSNVRLNGI